MKQLCQRTLLALLALMPTAMWAQTTFTQGDFTYTVTDDDAKTVSITKANEATLTGALVIPPSVTEESVTYAVTSIADNAFASTGITSITIPASVTSLGLWAFGSCTSLVDIRIEDSETPLEMPITYYKSFDGSNANKTVYIGRNLTPVEDYCVFDNATSVEFGPKVTAINNSLFNGASTLSNVVIGDGVTTIGNNAFQNAGTAESVESMTVTMGNGVTSIGESAFNGCSKLSSITLSQALTTIPDYAFANTALTSISIPASVTSLGLWAFGQCTSLVDIRIEDSETPLAMPDSHYKSFSGADANKTVYIGRNLTLGENYCVFDNATSVEFGPKVTAINNSLFNGASTLSNVVIGDAVTTIGDYAFQNAGTAESVESMTVTMGNGVTSIGNGAFNGCSKLSSITLSQALPTIPDYAFQNTAITAITIPASVTSIGIWAFDGCNSLADIRIEDSTEPLTMVGGYYQSFPTNADNQSVYVGRHLTLTEGNTAFPYVSRLTFGPMVTTIGDQAYYDCDALVFVDMSNSGVTTIGNKAFSRCDNLQTIDLGTKLTSLGGQAFSYSGLTSIEFPASLKTLPGVYDGDGLFEDCHALATVNLGSLEEIGAFAFYDCNALTEITIPATVKKIGRAPFYCNFTPAMKRMIIADSDTPLSFVNDTSEGSYGDGYIASTTLDYFYLGRDVTRADIGQSLVSNTKEIEIGPQVTNIDKLFVGNDQVENVTAHALTPIAISEDPFHSATYANATLWVPGGTKEAYASADGWKKFENVAHWSTLVTLTASTHGSIATAEATASNGTEQYRQPKNDDIVYTLTADTGYELTALTDNEVAVSLLPALDAEQTRANTEGEEFVTLVATFKAITYTITYDLAGGTVATANPATYNVESAAITLVNPTREGYTFAGWTGTALDGSAVEVSIPAGSTGDRTYTATWTPITYTISYDLAGGSVAGGLPASSYTIESAAITLPTPTKTGYTFKGWKLDGAGEAQMAVTIAAGSTGNKAYTATWQINQYTITFDSNGGSTVPSITQDYASAVSAPADPTREGYTFAGWNQDVPTTIPAENVTLTAQWTINQYTITFNTGGGSEVAAITQDYNTAVTAPAAPTKTGYTFKGWTPAVPSTIPAENMTLTAQWTINQYTITFDTDDGSAVPSITQDYNTAVTAPAAPTKTGYTFAGWTPVVPTTIPAEDITVKAQWTINTYSVSITGAGVTADNMNPKYQDDVVITIAEDPDRTLTSLKVNGEEVKDDMVGNQYTIESVAGNVTVVATFASTKEFITLPASSDYATFSCSQDLDFSEVSGLKAYIASGFDKTTGTVLLTRVESVPAGTGLLLRGTAGETYKVPYAESASYYVNMLKPVLTATTIDQTEGDYTNYFLGKQGDPEVIGFYKGKAEGTAVSAQKAYLQLPTSAVAAGTKSIGINFDDTTGVGEVKASTMAPEGVYDIHGRKIPAGQKLTRGIYIINGKKVSIK